MLICFCDECSSGMWQVGGVVTVPFLVQSDTEHRITGEIFPFPQYAGVSEHRFVTLAHEITYANPEANESDLVDFTVQGLEEGLLTKRVFWRDKRPAIEEACEPRFGAKTIPTTFQAGLLLR